MKKHYKQMTPLTRWFFRPFRFLIKTFFPLTYVKWQYYHITGAKLDLKNPIRYTEKLQYLRLFVYPKDPLVIQCTDRAGVREYVNKLNLQDYLIPIQGVYSTFDEIDFSKLKYPLVIKATHASGFNVILKSYQDLNYSSLRKKFKKYLKVDYGRRTLEKHYSPIKPQIILEDYLGDTASLPTEYKIHVYNGIARHLYVVTGRNVDIRYTNLYLDWSPFDGSQFNNWKKADIAPSQPANFAKMVALAETLGKPFPFVRVDLYNLNGKIYLGEMTFTPAKGTLKLDDFGTDYQIGSWLDISKYTNYE